MQRLFLVAAVNGLRPDCLTEVELGALLSRLPEEALYKTAVITIIHRIYISLFIENLSSVFSWAVEDIAWFITTKASNDQTTIDDQLMDGYTTQKQS